MSAQFKILVQANLVFIEKKNFNGKIIINYKTNIIKIFEKQNLFPVHVHDHLS
jgi:hypothetical protein